MHDSISHVNMLSIFIQITTYHISLSNMNVIVDILLIYIYKIVEKHMFSLSPLIITIRHKQHSS